MKPYIHLVATIATVPYILLATGFLLLGQLINSGSIIAFLDTLIAQFAWVMPWGLIGFVLALLLLATLGLFSQTRWLAGLLLCLLAGGSLGIILFFYRTIDMGKFLFLLPCLLVVLFAAWLVRSEWRLS